MAILKKTRKFNNLHNCVDMFEIGEESTSLYFDVFSKSFDKKTNTLKMPLLIKIKNNDGLYRVVSERENWYLWDKLKKHCPMLVTQIQEVKFGPRIFCVPDNAFKNTQFGNEKLLNIKSINMSSGQVCYIGKEAFADNNLLQDFKPSPYLRIYNSKCFNNTKIIDLTIQQPSQLSPYMSKVVDKSLKRYCSLDRTYIKDDNVHLELPLTQGASLWPLTITAKTNNIICNNLSEDNCRFYFEDKEILKNSDFLKDILAKYVECCVSPDIKILPEEFKHFRPVSYSMIGNYFRLINDINKRITPTNIFIGTGITEKCVRGKKLLIDNYLIECAYDLNYAIHPKGNIDADELLNTSIKYMIHMASNKLMHKQFTLVWDSDFSIPEKAFFANKNLVQAEVLKQVKIGSRAFAYTPLAELTGNYSELGSNALHGTNITSLVLPKYCKVGFGAYDHKVKVTRPKERNEYVVDDSDIEVITPTDNYSDMEK